MTDTVYGLIRKYRMISPGDHVICALSGGKDSMALLHVLLDLRGRLGFTLSAAHLNHQLRGDESRRDQNFVASHCKALGVPLVTECRDVSLYAKTHGLGLEEAARTLRYEFLSGISPNAKIATAHTADDNLETLLMHLIRGSGLQGLCGIQPVRGNIIRPFLTIERREIDDYLEKNSIPHVEDSTNGEDFCLRNRLRHQVVPLLKQENPALAGSASALCLSLLEEERCLDAEARKHYAALCDDSGLFIPGLLSLPENMQLRVLMGFCESVPRLQRNHLEMAKGLCTAVSPSGRLNLPGGYVLRREYDRLTLNGSTPVPDLRWVQLPLNGTTEFGAFRIAAALGPCPETLKQNEFALSLPRQGVVTLSTRRSGDTIRLSGGTKKLSRFMMDQKIPAHLRDTLPVVRYGEDIAALLPLTVDIRFRPKPGTGSLLLTVTRLEEVK